MKKLYRSRGTRVLGGVAAGAAEYFGVDITLMRLLFILVALFYKQAVLVYILAWVIIPEGSAAKTVSYRPEIPQGPVAAEATEDNTGLANGAADEVLGEPGPVHKAGGPADRGARMFGFILVAVGALILFKKMVPSYWWRWPARLANQWWPLGVILIGVAMILGVIKGRGE